MIRDLARETPSETEHAGVCIVGAGAAGIALAVECARRGRKVTLLEAGGEAVEDAAHDSSRGTQGGRPYRGMQQGRAKRLGGTTTLWGGQILELDAIDFEERSWVAGSGWPFQKDTLSPFYARALELEGVAPALVQDAAVWARLRQPAPALDELEVYFSRWCPEPNFERLHRTFLQGPDVTVWLHAAAVEAVCEGEHVRGIQARTAEGRSAIFRAEQYVFCLGSIETARFFLQPAGNHGKPWHRSRLIGCFFQDHIDCNAATLVPRDAAGLHAAFDTVYLQGRKYSPKLRLSAGAQRESRSLNVGATVFSTAANAEELDAVKGAVKEVLRGRPGALQPAHVGTALRSAPLLARQAWRYAMQHRAYHAPAAPLRLRVHCEQLPMGSSTIRLTGERDAFGLLRASVCWAIAPQELESIRRFVDQVRLSLSPYADVLPDPLLARTDGSFASRCEDSFHHMGGMRMDPSPARGVVDPNLRLHGTSNLYVCSAAVYPSSGFSNPTHTLLALAARLAQHLA